MAQKTAENRAGADNRTSVSVRIWIAVALRIPVAACVTLPLAPSSNKVATRIAVAPTMIPTDSHRIRFRYMCLSGLLFFSRTLEHTPTHGSFLLAEDVVLASCFICSDTVSCMSTVRCAECKQ
jgi:hypothetical protein